MSIFGQVVEKQSTYLTDRYNALKMHAENLQVDLQIIGVPLEITAESLDEWQKQIDAEALKNEIRTELGAHTQEFHIDSIEHLDWFLQKRLHYHAELAAIKAQYDALIRTTQGNINSLDFLYKNEAEDFVRMECEREGKKTIVRPFASCQLRHEKPAWKVKDEVSLQEWLATLPDDLKQQYGVIPKTYARDLDKVKEAAERVRLESGEASIPGLEYDVGGSRCYIKVPKKEKE